MDMNATENDSNLDADIDIADLLAKVRIAQHAIFEVEKCLRNNGICKNEWLWRNAFNARCNIGEVEDWCLRNNGTRGN